MNFNLTIAIGDKVQNLTLPADADEEGKFCLVEISGRDIAQYWYPGSKITVTSSIPTDRVEVLLYEDGIHASEKIKGHREKVPVIFEITRQNWKAAA